MRRVLLLLLLVSPVCTADPPKDLAGMTARLATVLEGKQHFIRKLIRRMGNQMIEFEAFIATPGDSKLFLEVLSDFPGYASWVLNRINQRPSGGSYYMQILDLRSDTFVPSMIDTRFRFDFPLFQREVERRFSMNVKKIAECTLIEGKTLPHETALIVFAHGYLEACPAMKFPETLWIYVVASIKIRSKILYELLPDTILNREANDRIHTIIENYLTEELRRKTYIEPTKPKPGL